MEELYELLKKYFYFYYAIFSFSYKIIDFDTPDFDEEELYFDEEEMEKLNNEISKLKLKEDFYEKKVEKYLEQLEKWHNELSHEKKLFYMKTQKPLRIYQDILDKLIFIHRYIFLDLDFDKKEEVDSFDFPFLISRVTRNLIRIKKYLENSYNERFEKYLFFVILDNFLETEIKNKENLLKLKKLIWYLLPDSDFDKKELEEDLEKYEEIYLRNNKKYAYSKELENWDEEKLEKFKKYFNQYFLIPEEKLDSSNFESTIKAIKRAFKKIKTDLEHKYNERFDNNLFFFSLDKCLEAEIENEEELKKLRIYLYRFIFPGFDEDSIEEIIEKALKKYKKD